jgi:CPA2 family monovalent cation:H+ antiporter-2
MNILFDLVIILSFSAVSLFISSRLKLPSILAFIIAGVIVGPYGVEMISTIDEVNVMAEIGILLLLFSIGIEFSLKKLMKSSLWVFVGGSLQVIMSILLFTTLAIMMNVAFNQALFIGMLLAMSSTAIVLQLFQEKGWMNTTFGISSISVLIFQDIIIIPMMLLTPFLVENHLHDSGALVNLILGFAIITIVVLAARKLVPKVLRTVVQTRNSELFLMTVIIICFTTAFVTYQLGLKLALGAFLAGLIISESEYSYEALKNIKPFGKIFTAIFFVSIGMYLDLSFLIQHFLLIAVLTLSVMVIKAIVVFQIFVWLKTGIRSAIVSGLVLCQVGEFAFVLSKAGMDLQLLSDFSYQVFLSISILSMILSAIIITSSPRIADGLVETRLFTFIYRKSGLSDFLPKPCTLTEHTVIIGYGPGGKRIAKQLANMKMPLAIIELNDRNIRNEDHNIAQVFIGNAEENEVLERAAITLANYVIITVPDPAAAEAITTKVRKLNHDAGIVVRTKYQDETEQLYKLGADKVVPEEISVADTITGLFTTAS